MDKKWVAIGAVAIIVIGVAVALSLNRAFAASSGTALTVSGEAQGFGGPVTARVTLSGSRITGLEIAGEQETPAIGGAAIASLTESILAAGSIEGVNAVSGATITSNAVFNAIREALP